MDTNEARKSVCVITATLVFGFVLWYRTSGSHIKVAPTFTAKDVRAIRSIVSSNSWAEARKSIVAGDFKRAWNSALPVLLSRTENISGFPGAPGIAQIDCRGVLFDIECTFTVFNSTNGWKFHSIELTNAQKKN